MKVASKNLFSAVDASLGYFYQVRIALLWSLRRLKVESDFLVSIETLDDVTFETADGDPFELLQTKHHLTGPGALTDASPDLWKSLRIWFEGQVSGSIISTTKLYLVTTGTASEGSAASLLRPDDSRDIVEAQRALDATALSSTNKVNEPAYRAYLAANPSERKRILENVIILDTSPDITDLDTDLKREIYWAADREHHTAFLERLEGWWYRRVLRQLTDTSANRIGSVEIEGLMSDLREQFKLDALPIDDDLLEFTLDDATRAAHENSVFVRQLELAKAGKRRISAAIQNYYRAFEQRSRWLRNDLVVDMDLKKYEKRLCEEWELVFESVRDELGDSATEEAKEESARTVLTWTERAVLPIRSSITEPFVSRGSFHILADEIRIGWHPEFRERLASLLNVGGAIK